jgi:DMSO reductase anchor subunit
MHPAPSIIAFTVLSGLGFGMMAWLGIGAGKGEALVAATYAALAMALAGAGLLSSLLHLGQPRRFLKAFTQWRSSWLSREAVLAIAAFAAFGLYAAIWVLAGLRLLPLGALAASLALATVFATSMIYAQMKSVPRWRSPTTPLVFLLAALSGGALLAAAMEPAGWLLAALGLAQLADWITGDRRFAGAGTTLASATGLGAMGRLRMLEPPHTGPNYLTREMVHVVGRAHAGKLRVIGLVLAVLLPLALAGFRDVGHLNAGLAVLAHVAGMLVLRWCFFAQAEHVVGLYYGKR